MSLWTRITNALHPDRLEKEIDEEVQSHLHEAIQQGRDPNEARRAFGSPLRQREETRDARIIAILDSLRADAIFGYRRLTKSKITSAAAILSLALAIGACTSAFRLIDALLLRPLPIAHPERLQALFRHSILPDGKPRKSDSYEYPVFQQMREAAKDHAELIAISYASPTDITYTTDQDMEKATVQYVSGSMFHTFGLQPTQGRLLTEADDTKSGANPYAVLSHDYWISRFAADPKIIGRTFRVGNNICQIVGVGPARFTGTEPGTVIDIFLPAAMHPEVTNPNSAWLRAFVYLKSDAPTQPMLDKLRAVFRADNEERAKGFIGRPKQFVAHFLGQVLEMEPVAAGISGMQKDYRLALTALGLLVTLVLLIACANVANLMTAQAASRAREMALRVSIGAGRARLIQLVLVESAWIAILAASLGALFADWSAPFVVRIINVRLLLPTDWRVLAFGLALTLTVTFLFGLAPAFRASAVKPASALKGGEDPHSRRLMHALIAAQVAFCFLVLFVAGLFVATFERLSNQPTGFSAERLLTLDTIAARPQPKVYWDQVAEHLRTLPGIETVAISAWPLLSGNGTNGFISINGAPPPEVFTYFLRISPGWLDTMRIPLIDGRDFRPTDTFPGTAIVNEAFARQFFNGENPIGRSFDQNEAAGKRISFQIVGLTRDARYRDMREPITATVYTPLEPKTQSTFIVRTTNPNPLTLAQYLRQEIPRARPEFRVSNIRTQKELNESHTLRERLLAMLAIFFAAVALLLAGVGLYGVLDYAVLQRRREIGIRIAIGAQPAGIAKLVTKEIFAMVLTGAIAGLALGLIAARYIATLFYQVKPTDAQILALPALAILTAALLAALPAIIHAVRIDPVTMLRSE